MIPNSPQELSETLKFHTYVINIDLNDPDKFHEDLFMFDDFNTIL